MSRPESTRTAAIYALFDDGAVLSARDVADDTASSVQIASARLHRLWKRGRLSRTGERGDRGGWGFLYSAVRS